jgi:hypothetical protein
LAIDICFRCCHRRLVSRSRTLGGRILLCQVCQQKLDNTKRCAYCHELKPVVFRDEKNRPVCQACWRREFNLTRPEVKARPRSVGRAVQCAFCPDIVPAQYRTCDGKAVCARCYKKQFYVYPTHTCMDCDRDRKVAKWFGPDKTDPLCHTCYRRELAIRNLVTSPQVSNRARGQYKPRNKAKEGSL